MLERLRSLLALGSAEREPEFREQIERSSLVGLQVIGFTTLALSALLFLARLLLYPDPYTLDLRLLQTALCIVLGTVTIVIARLHQPRRYARPLAILIAVLLGGVLVWSGVQLSDRDPTAMGYVPGQVAIIMLVGVAALPLQPRQTLLVGLLLELVYIGVTENALQRQVGQGAQSLVIWFILVMTVLCTGLSTVLYRQRQALFDYFVRARQSETRMALAENAATLGRLAAALSHELNSPVGALISGVDTLLLLSGRQVSAPPHEQERLLRLQADLRSTIKASAKRLQELVQRLQRFTNLDKAEVGSADLNEMLRDVLELLDERLCGRVIVELDFAPLPALVCRPQQLSAVFSNLITNGLRSLDEQGRVTLRTRHDGSAVLVEIADNGQGMDAGQLAGVFDPGFQVRGERVASGNWGLFSSRQIVREHGGEIEISSQPGQGTTVRVRLPLEAYHLEQEASG